MLIEGKVVLVIGLFLIVRAEPEGEAVGYSLNALANVSSCQGVSRVARIVNAGELNSFIKSGGEESSLAES